MNELAWRKTSTFFLMELLLTPLALAVWAMDDGCKVGYGFKLSTNSFTLTEVQQLCAVLHEIYGLVFTVQDAGSSAGDQYVIYIASKSMELFRDIVRPHFHESILY